MEQHEIDDMLANQRMITESLMLRVAMLEKILFAGELSPNQKHVFAGDEEYSSNVMHMPQEIK